MKVEHKKIADKIHLLTFETQQDITSTFLRFQEHYESPNFRGKFFSLEEFKDWYVQNSSNGKKTGEFTYYSDWNGFNIPSYVLKPFYAGEFGSLSNSEKKILEMFENEQEAFYVIGVHKESSKHAELLTHEIAHGFFYTNDNYRKTAQEILSRFDTNSIKEELRLKAGYHEDVLEDEVHAYSIDSAGGLETPIPEKLSEELRKLYKIYI